MAEMFGKVEGCSRGRGGSMHLFDAAHRFYGGNGDRRRRAAAGRRAGPGRPDAGPRPGHRVLLRRGRDGRGRVPRVDEPRRAVAAAGAVPVREQPVRHGHRAGALGVRDQPAAQGRDATRCRPGRCDGMDVLRRARGGRGGPSSWCATAADRCSSRRAPTGSGRTRCTTRTATATRPRSSSGGDRDPIALLGERLTADGLLTDADVEAAEQDDHRGDRRRRRVRGGGDRRAGGAAAPVRAHRAGAVMTTRPRTGPAR